MTVPFKFLEIWRHALTNSVRSDAPDLSARQMALLLSVYLGDGPHTVRGLAQILKISKPAVSRALDRLGELGYILRQRDDLDRRNVLVQRTPEGGNFLTTFAGMIADASRHADTMPASPMQAAEAALAAVAAAAGVGYNGASDGHAVRSDSVWAREAAE